MSHDTYSTRAAHGSTNEYAILPPAKTSAQIAEDAALAARRVDSFMNDASSYPPYNTNHPNGTVSRIQAAASNIVAFNMAFNNRNGNNNYNYNSNNNSNNTLSYNNTANNTDARE